jgi:hypothetical protein
VPKLGSEPATFGGSGAVHYRLFLLGLHPLLMAVCTEGNYLRSDRLSVDLKSDDEANRRRITRHAKVGHRPVFPN